MILIKNGILYTMTDNILDPGDVLIENDKIVEVGKQINRTLKTDDLIIDASGLWVMPGIIDAHCHLGTTEEKKGIEGRDDNESTTPITPYLRAMDAINPFDPAFHNALQAGITSVMSGPDSANVVGGQFAFLKTHGREINKILFWNFTQLWVDKYIKEV